MRLSGFAVLAASALLASAGARAEPICDSLRAAIAAAKDRAWTAPLPTLTFDGAPASCVTGSGKSLSCTLATLHTCADRMPTQQEITDFQARMQRLYATLPQAVKACFPDRTGEPYSNSTVNETFAQQSRGQQFKKAGEATIRLVESVTRTIAGDAYRCETNRSGVEIEFERQGLFD